MSILVKPDTKFIVQGITGGFGGRHAQLSLEYGSQLVAGVTPGKGGQTFADTVPIFDSVTEAAARTVAAIRSSIAWTNSNTSETRIAVTLANRSVTAISISLSATGRAWRVASWVCGAVSSTPGENTITKLIRSERQRTSRLFAIVPVISRPSTLTLRLSPMPSPSPTAAPAESEISGGPV